MRVPRTGCGEIPFGGVRQESSRVDAVGAWSLQWMSARGRWNLHIQHLPEPARSQDFLLIVDKLQTFKCVATPDQRFFYLSSTNYRLWMCCLTRSMIFLLIVDKLPTFGGAVPRDHRYCFSSWRNIRPVDVLPHQSTEISSQYRYINYFC
ncbi:hypothetical protein TNCV_3578561 [Trichonephila clavipes]|nr:hypothetical protein TNCV_3578561 [Trichonephila clavipes]